MRRTDRAARWLDAKTDAELGWLIAAVVLLAFVFIYGALWSLAILS